MGKFEVIDRLVDEGNGYLCTSKVVECGISKHTLAAYVDERHMEKVGHGVYLSTDGWQDPFYELSLQNSRIIFSHECALYLHGLMEREPARLVVTVPAGYNASHLRKQGISVFQEKKEFSSLGRMDVETNYGNRVAAFDRERTICDIVRHKKRMDIQVFQYAIKEYMDSSGKDINRLMAYARELGTLDTVRLYTEVML